MPDKNLMDYTIWADGQTGAIGLFGVYSNHNRRIIGNNPWGKSSVVWEAYSDADNTGGGIYYTAQPIDNTKMYRMSWWENRVTNGAATICLYYAGLNGYGTTNGVYNRLTGALDTNPYFWSTALAGLPVNTWFLVVGHVWPAGSGIGANHPDSGRYYANNATRFGTISRDYVWEASSTTGRSRTLMVYTPNGAGVSHYTIYPRTEIVDGSEPTINELVKGWDSRLRRTYPLPAAFSFRI